MARRRRRRRRRCLFFGHAIDGGNKNNDSVFPRLSLPRFFLRLLEALVVVVVEMVVGLLEMVPEKLQRCQQANRFRANAAGVEAFQEVAAALRLTVSSHGRSERGFRGVCTPAAAAAASDSGDSGGGSGGGGD